RAAGSADGRSPRGGGFGAQRITPRDKRCVSIAGAQLLRGRNGAQFVHLRGMRLESLPRELTAELSTSASLVGAAPPVAHPPFHPTYIPVEPSAAPPER